MRYLLIPVTDAMPAIHAHLTRWAIHERPSPEEIRALVRLACRFAVVAEALIGYLKTLRQRPNPN